ncbi:SWF/SNF helicase family protein, partial [Enterococcus faecium]|nr:SWF/SNF helicase family protein [Enterococcus faecium]
EDIYNLVEKIEESSKTKATIELIKKLVSENKKTIVWCIFISSIELLENKCEELGLSAISIYGETSMDERLKLIKEFQKGQYDILITNPHTLAESVSLHQVCHDAIYYEYSFNLVHLLQSKDRIHRLGLADNQYTQYYYMQSKYIYNEQVYSLDDRIYHRLMEKEKIMLDAIDHDILEKVTSFEEDLKIIFQDF